MKLAALSIMFLFSCLRLQAAGQRYSFFIKDMPFERAIKTIESKTGYSFLYTKQDIWTDAKVTLEVKDEEIKAILDKLFQPLQLAYSIDNKIVVISAKRISVADASTKSAVDAVKGIVQDEKGRPLEGATVKCKGAEKGVVTGVDGRFSMAKVCRVIEVSYIGYDSKEVAVSGEVNLSIKLDLSKGELDNLQVIAYGTTSRRLSTGNTSTIKGADIEKQPVGNSLIAMQGRVPGLFIQQGSGAPGATMNIRIQGTNSLLGGGEPFYVVDGVPYASTLLYTVSNSAIWGDQSLSLAREGNGSPLSYLNPSDIESIEVLKDADATAIYGSKAANGAILITTKRGRIGATAIDIGITSGWEDMPKRIKLLNAQQYLEMRHEAIRNSNANISASDYDLNGTWDTTRSTDWQEVFLGKSSNYLNGRVQVSGGNAGANYLVGVTYSDRRGMLSGDFSDKKVSTHFALNTTSANQKFKLQLSANYMVDNNRLPSVNITSNMLYMSPVAPALRNADGSLNWALNSAGVSTWLFGGQHPLAALLNKFNTNVNNLVSNLVLSYSLLPNLELKTSLGYTYMQSDQLNTYPLSASQPYLRPFILRSSTFVFNNMRSYLAEPQLFYHKLVGKGRLDVLLGGTVQKSVNSGRAVNAQGQVSDAQLENISAAPSLTALPDLYSIYRYAALFTRLSYNYSNKYLLNATLRRDGSSRFGPNSRFHSFGAIGAAWVLSEEAFLKLPHTISFLKAKISYGTTGNDQIGDYAYMNLYSPYNVDIPYGGTNSLSVNGLSNNELQWEETKKLNLGMDIGFFSDRILLGVNYSINKSTNLLQNFNLPFTSGYTNILRNFAGTVQNTSLEVTLNSSVVKNKSFSWSVGANFTRGRNKLLKLPESNKLTDLAYYGYVVGMPLGVYYVYHYRGIDPQTGLYVVEDAKGNPTSSPNFDTDRKVLMNLQRPYYAGFNNSIMYRGLQLDIFIQFVKQRASRFYQAAGYRPGRALYNQPISVLNRWQKPGDIAGMPKFATSGQNELFVSTDAYFEDASFARLKNVSLSWGVPEEYLKKAKIRNLRLSLNMQNLLTFTKYSGLDPETGNSAIQPFRTVVIGLQMGL